MKYCLIIAVFLLGSSCFVAAQQSPGQVMTPLNLSTGIQGSVAQQGAIRTPIESRTPPVVPVFVNRYELRGCIKIDNARVDRVPEYRVYYQGREQRSNNEGFFSFSLNNNDLSKYSLVVCKTLDQSFEKGNTVDHYGVVPDKDYRYFTFKKNQQGLWVAQEKKLTKKKFAIPKHALVVLIDPKCVDRLDPWEVNVTESIVKLPVIVLKQDIDLNKLRRYSAKSMLYALDSRPFHRTERFERKSFEKNPNVQLVLDR